MYPVTSIFYSLQGEAHLRGFPMAFVRLSGCSVGCVECDTDYSKKERLSVEEIADRVRDVFPAQDRDQWVWITGGEPTDHDLLPLLRGLKRRGFSTAVATSGVRRLTPPVDWLSVSPHSDDPAQFLQRYGNEIKLIDGLNGLDPLAWIAQWGEQIDFWYRYIQPRSLQVDGVWREDPESLRRCIEAVRSTSGRWALSRQDHHYWSMA